MKWTTMSAKNKKKQDMGGLCMQAGQKNLNRILNLNNFKLNLNLHIFEVNKNIVNVALV